MYPKLSTSVVLAMLGLTVALALGPRAQADDTVEPSLDDQKSTVDKDNKLHLNVVADMNAPQAKVYEALVHPEKVAKYDANVTGVRIVSHNAGGEVVEFKGQTLPIPNAPPAIQVKYSFDANKKSVTAESVGKTPVQFRSEYLLSPSKDGKSTEIKYSSVSTSAGPVMGFEPPKFMRQQFALDAFMRQMHNVGRYIQSGGK